MKSFLSSTDVRTRHELRFSLSQCLRPLASRGVLLTRIRSVHLARLFAVLLLLVVGWPSIPPLIQLPALLYVFGKPGLRPVGTGIDWLPDDALVTELSRSNILPNSAVIVAMVVATARLGPSLPANRRFGAKTH